jgi:hypothetical protein
MESHTILDIKKKIIEQLEKLLDISVTNILM